MLALTLNLSRCLPIALSMALIVCPLWAQDAPRVMLRIEGVPREAHTATVGGRIYVDVDGIVLLLGATGDLRGNRLTVYLPERGRGNATPGLSPALVEAGIEYMAVVREWRRGIINATVNSTPFLVQWVDTQQRDAETKLAFVSAAANTDDDRSAITLLMNEARMIREFSDKYVEKRKESTGVFPEEIENDPLSQHILDCARGLAAMAGTRRFQDVAACH